VFIPDFHAIHLKSRGTGLVTNPFPSRPTSGHRPPGLRERGKKYGFYRLRDRPYKSMCEAMLTMLGRVGGVRALLGLCLGQKH
jgi:hypothetical protein